MLKLLTFLKGYVYVSADSVFMERFLNALSKKRIYVWGIKRRGLGSVTFYLSIRAVEHLRAVARDTNTHIKVIEKTGLPFVLFNLKKRKGLWISGLVCIVLLLIANLFIWDIQTFLIDDKGTSKEITIPLPIHIGQLKSSIDKERLSNEILLTSDEYAYASVNIAGTVATISLRERKNAEPEEDNRACSVVAKRAGIIDRIVTHKGQQMVKAQQSVGAGDLLVSGIVETRDYGVRMVHSKAEIIATTWHRKTSMIELKEEQSKRTGKANSRHSISAFGYKIPLYLGEGKKFSSSEREKDTKKLRIGNFALPFSFNYDRIYETKKTTHNLTLSDAVEKEKVNLQKSIEAELEESAKVLEKKYYLRTIETGERSLVCEIKVQEDIGEIKYEE